MEWTSSLNYINNEINVHMSTGSTSDSHPTLPLRVCEFHPPDRDFLRVSGIKPQSNDQLTYVTTYPFAIRNTNITDLKEPCLEYIKAISSYEFIVGEPDTIRYKTLRAISNFQRTDPTAQGARTHLSLGLQARG